MTGYIRTQIMTLNKVMIFFLYESILKNRLLTNILILVDNRLGDVIY